MTFTLEHPKLIEYATVIVSRYPKLFNKLLGFAQSHGIVMAPEELGYEANRVNSAAELNPRASLIFDELQSAFKHNNSNQTECE